MLFKRIRVTILLLGLLSFSLRVSAQIVLKHSDWEWKISETGCAEQLIFKGGKRNDTIPFFREGEHAFMQNGKVKKCVDPGFRMDTPPIGAR